ncbi:hypothetical protein H4219_001025 [Mycoemilia scoparia]|uniref:PIN domain-containing protein n=1 Tax=Mycoemilia scoparia TaxID=417184 RepID=A0A9W8DWC9_9FUNG|nr:hypothetical protein H4219_001025 [Mycoemilia scoparia]
MDSKTGLLSVETESKRMKQKESNMRVMAELLLKSQVKSLEKDLVKMGVSKKKIDKARDNRALAASAVLPKKSFKPRPLWILDAQTWVEHLKSIEELVNANNKVTVILAQSVIDGLDKLVKGISSNTSNASRARMACRLIEKVLSDQIYKSSKKAEEPQNPIFALIAQRPDQSVYNWTKNAKNYLTRRTSSGVSAFGNKPTGANTRQTSVREGTTPQTDHNGEGERNVSEHYLEHEASTRSQSGGDIGKDTQATSREGVPLRLSPDAIESRQSARTSKSALGSDTDLSSDEDNGDNNESHIIEDAQRMGDISQTMSANIDEETFLEKSPESDSLLHDPDQVPYIYRRILSCAIYYSKMIPSNTKVEDLPNLSDMSASNKAVSPARSPLFVPEKGSPVLPVSTTFGVAKAQSPNPNKELEKEAYSSSGTPISEVVLVTSDSTLASYASWFGIICESYDICLNNLLQSNGRVSGRNFKGGHGHEDSGSRGGLTSEDRDPSVEVHSSRDRSVTGTDNSHHEDTTKQPQQSQNTETEPKRKSFIKDL